MNKTAEIVIIVVLFVAIGTPSIAYMWFGWHFFGPAGQARAKAKDIEEQAV